MITVLIHSLINQKNLEKFKPGWLYACMGISQVEILNFNFSYRYLQL